MRVPTIVDVVEAVSPIVIAVRRVWAHLFGSSTTHTPRSEAMTIHGPSNVLNPLIKGWVSGLIRHVLVALGTLLAGYGIASPEDVTSFTEAAVPIVVGLVFVVGAQGWSWLETFWTRQKLVTALALPAGKTEQHVEAVIALGNAPPATLAKTEAPPKISEPFVGTGPKPAA
jgi:hypothetical protein